MINTIVVIGSAFGILYSYITHDIELLCFMGFVYCGAEIRANRRE